ncbi:MarR family winged helix-turn-helix transcriptional regulator [Paenibacillus amylolyticus]|uniref:MarR family winged helix-turn-helix transcriptional regulator n=1 Tax=Paenibacillus amylolyticus TaxID=1451 RepID=UPI0039AEE49B
MSENPVKTKDRAALELALGEQIHALISASHALNVRSAERFDANLQPAAFQLVRWLYSYGPTSAAALAEANAMDRSSVSRLIKQLEKSGYVSKEQDPKDRRGVLLSLTELGQQSTVAALKEKESAFYNRISRWDDKELERFTAMLRQFNGLDDETVEA